MLPSVTSEEHASKPTHSDLKSRKYTPLNQALEAYNAFAYANDVLRQPLNTFLTINFVGAEGWEAGRRGADVLPSIREKFKRSLSQWCDRVGIDALWVYANENPPSGGHGPHIHILMHLPPDRFVELRAKMIRCMCLRGGWDMALVSNPAPAHDKRKPVHVEPWRGDRALDEVNAQRSLSYMMKGLDPEAVIEHGGARIKLRDLPSNRDGEPIELQEPGDVETTKLAGSSRALGKKARGESGWVEKSDMAWMKMRRSQKSGDAEKLRSSRAALTGLGSSILLSSPVSSTILSVKDHSAGDTLH